MSAPTPVPPSRFRPPSRPPTHLELENAQAWTAYQTRGLQEVKASAIKWRDGLGALVTVVTGALVIGGPDALAKLDPEWRYPVTALIFLGYGLTVVGLWNALHAAAGNPASTTLDTLQAEQRSIREREVAQAIADAKRIKSARTTVVWALALLWVGTLVWWLAPQPSDPDPSFDNRVKISLVDNTEVCGTLVAADDAGLVLKTTGTSPARTIPLDNVRAVHSGTCP